MQLPVLPQLCLSQVSMLKDQIRGWKQRPVQHCCQVLQCQCPWQGGSWQKRNTHQNRLHDLDGSEVQEMFASLPTALSLSALAAQTLLPTATMQHSLLDSLVT